MSPHPRHVLALVEPLLGGVAEDIVEPEFHDILIARAGLENEIIKNENILQPKRLRECSVQKSKPMVLIHESDPRFGAFDFRAAREKAPPRPALGDLGHGQSHGHDHENNWH